METNALDYVNNRIVLKYGITLKDGSIEYVNKHETPSQYYTRMSACVELTNNKTLNDEDKETVYDIIRELDWGGTPIPSGHYFDLVDKLVAIKHRYAKETNDSMIHYKRMDELGDHTKVIKIV